jgi:hypothetical protein
VIAEPLEDGEGLPACTGVDLGLAVDGPTPVGAVRFWADRVREGAVGAGRLPVVGVGAICVRAGRFVVGDRFRIAEPFRAFVGDSVGAERLARGRHFIGVELDAGYFDIARKRIESVQPALMEAAD